jgi:hypothetical protein
MPPTTTAPPATPCPPPPPPERRFCQGIPCLVINGVRHWSAPLPPGFQGVPFDDFKEWE